MSGISDEQILSKNHRSMISSSFIILSLYFLIGWFLVQSFGTEAISTALIPVIIIGYKYGRWPAVVVSILQIGLNIVLLTLLGFNGVHIIFTSGLIGSFVMIFVGYFVGRMSDLQRNVFMKNVLLQQSQEKLAKEQQEKELLNAQLDSIFKNTPVGIIIIQDGIIQFTNDKIADLYNYPSTDHLKGKSIENLQPDHELKKLRERGKKREKGESVVSNYETIGKRRDGTTFPITVNAATITLPDGIATLAFINDISEIKKHQRELKMREQKIYQLQKSEAIYLLGSGIAHDINNMLSILLGYSQMINQSNTDELVSQYLDKIEKTVDKLSTMVKKLLSLDKNEKNSITEMMEIHSFIRGEFNLLHRLTRDDILLQFELSSEEVFIEVEPNHITQILMNLILNAQEAIDEEGEITIKTASKDTDDGSFFELTVEDTGSGIPEDELDEIFVPFYTSKDYGTGLGLPSIKRIIEMYSGKIEVTSTLGEGSNFTVSLPIAKIEVPNC